MVCPTWAPASARPRALGSASIAPIASTLWFSSGHDSSSAPSGLEREVDERLHRRDAARVGDGEQRVLRAAVVAGGAVRAVEHVEHVEPGAVVARPRRSARRAASGRAARRAARRAAARCSACQAGCASNGVRCASPVRRPMKRGDVWGRMRRAVGVRGARERRARGGSASPCSAVCVRLNVTGTRRAAHRLHPRAARRRRGLGGSVAVEAGRDLDDPRPGARARRRTRGARRLAANVPGHVAARRGRGGAACATTRSRARPRRAPRRASVVIARARRRPEPRPSSRLRSPIA